MSERSRRTTAEWVVFACSCAIVVAVVVLLGSQLPGAEEPATPVAHLRGEVREAAGRFYVPVDVTNEGDLTAADVQVLAELTIDGKTFDGEQTVDFLAGQETERLVFSFDDDPRSGELVVRVAGHSQP